MPKLVGKKYQRQEELQMFKLPISVSRGTTFDYEGVEVQLSPLRYNEYTGEGGSYITDISWKRDGVESRVNGVAVVSGIDILGQHTTPLPNLYAISKNNRSRDMSNTNDVNLYILD